MKRQSLMRTLLCVPLSGLVACSGGTEAASDSREAPKPTAPVFEPTVQAPASAGLDVELDPPGDMRLAAIQTLLEERGRGATWLPDITRLLLLEDTYGTQGGAPSLTVYTDGDDSSANALCPALQDQYVSGKPFARLDVIGNPAKRLLTRSSGEPC